MDNDIKLFEDEIKEGSDLLDIGLDDLEGFDTSESKEEESDEAIIELTDLLEKGDAELFGEDDVLKEEASFNDMPAGFADELTDDAGLDSLLQEAGLYTPDNLETSVPEDVSIDPLSPDNAPNDSDIIPPETDLTGDVFEKLLDDTALDDTALDDAELDDAVLDEALFDDLAGDTEEGPGTADDSDMKPLWGSDGDINANGTETETTSLLEDASYEDEEIEFTGIDEGAPGYVHLDDIQLDAKPLEDIFQEESLSSAPVNEISDQDESMELPAFDMEEAETVLSAGEAEAEPEILVTDYTGSEDEPRFLTAETIIPTVISEERIEEIVTKTVSETVERVAREVFKEVAEKVISEAIEGLKKSLEAELE